MNMKNNIIRLFMMAVFSAVALGCAPDESGIEGSFPYLNLDFNAKRLSKVGGSEPVVIEVNTNRALVVKFIPQSDWITAEVSGNQISLFYKDNELEQERIVTLGISTVNSTVYKEIVITQDASGELTFRDGDLILRTKEEIANNTYTKTVGNLIIGNLKVPTRSVTEDVNVKLGDTYYAMSESDITDADLEPLNETIHEVQGKGLVVANTKVTQIPVELIQSVGIERLNFDYNEMTVLPAQKDISTMNLVELSLKGNDLTDISNLAGANTIEYLDISENEIYNIEHLKSMSGLKKVILNGLPLATQQVEVFKESSGFDIIAENLDTEDSPLPEFGELEITEVSDTKVELKVPLLNNTNSLKNYGFYIGNKRTLADMTFYDKAHVIGGELSMTFKPETIKDKIFFVRAYAENNKGANYSKAGSFGNVSINEDVRIQNDADFAAFADYPYSHINASLLVGKTTSSSSSSNILLDDGKYYTYFAPTTFADMSSLRQVVYVKDGLYMGNIGLNNLDYISHIEGIQTLWLKANNISYIPELESDQTITHLDLSMNRLSDFNFLERMPNLEKLYLGSEKTSAKETNDIGVLTGLEQYSNLKYIDLSGLPLHEWQVEKLREQMPDTDIEFTSSGRTPHLPTVSLGRVSRSESSVTLSGSVTSKGKSDILEYGFYFGKDVNSLEKYAVGSSISEGNTFNLTIELSDMDMYYYYPYAINSQGESYCELEEVSLSYMNLSTGETANCYLITTPGRYKFDARVRGNSLESVGNMSYAEVIWQYRAHFDQSPIISEIEFEDGFVKFEVPEDAAYGNALIAVKDSQGTILWSWHIWLCDFNPDTDSQVYWDGATMMDRNLGATTNTSTTYDDKLRASGMMYQWGRKDPFNQNWYSGYYSGILSTLEYAHQNPTVLIAGGNEWINPSDGNGFYMLWSAESKTMYDPCPPGWMVADRSVFEATYVQYGNDYYTRILYNSGKSSHYPFTPYFDPWANYNEGYEGRIWTSSIDNGGWCPYAISYNNTDRYFNNYEASFAYSVRCMEDLGLAISGVQVNPHLTTADVSATVTCMYATVSQKGFVWCRADYGTPTLSNDSVYLGSGTGTFSTTLEDLSPDTTYYIRAYAVVDGVTKYGPTVEFKTGRGGTGDDFTEDDYIWE